MGSMTTPSKFVEVHAVRVALSYDYMPHADKLEFDNSNPVQKDGKVRFTLRHIKQEAAFRTLANKVQEACVPKVFLFSVPFNDKSGTLDYIFYETYIGAHSTPIDLDCIRQFAATLKEKNPEGLAFRMIVGEDVQTFMLPEGMWKEITNIPKVISKGLPRWFVFPEHGGIRQPNNLLPLTNYKLKGARVAWWKSDQRKNRFDPESKWVQENDEGHGVPVFAYGEKSYEEAAHAVCIDIANGGVNANNDSVTAFGNLRFLTTQRGVQKTSEVLTLLVPDPTEPPQNKRKHKQEGLSSVFVFDAEFMTRIVYKLTDDRLKHEEGEGKRDSDYYPVVLALPEQYLSIENPITERVFKAAVSRFGAGESTYILVPVLNKASWTVSGLFISPTQALRLHGNPNWTLDDDKRSHVVDKLYTSFCSIHVNRGESGLCPTLQDDVADISCSMYFTADGNQSDTGTSVVAMLMSQIGMTQDHGTPSYNSLPHACDYCQQTGGLLKIKLDAFAANAVVARPHSDEDDSDGGKDDGGKDDSDDDHDNRKRPSVVHVVKKKQRTQGFGSASLDGDGEHINITFDDDDTKRIPVANPGVKDKYYPVEVTDVPGDGNCFYYALYRALANSGVLLKFQETLHHSRCAIRIEVGNERTFSNSLRAALANFCIEKHMAEKFYHGFLEAYTNQREDYVARLKFQPLWLRDALSEALAAPPKDFVSEETFKGIIKKGFEKDGNVVAEFEIKTLERMLEQCNVPILIATYNSIPTTALKTAFDKTVVNLLNKGEYHWMYLQFTDTDSPGQEYKQGEQTGAISGVKFANGEPYIAIGNDDAPVGAGAAAGSDGGRQRLSRLHRYASLD